MILRTALLLAASLVTLNTAYAETPANCITKVSSHSNRAHAEAQNYAVNVEWKNLTLTPTSIGYGSAGGREYELTIVDGKVYRVRPSDKGAIEALTDTPTDGGAFMLQLASPKSWKEHGKLEAMSSFDDLNFALDSLVDDMGCGDLAVLPFKITGKAEKFTWSLDTLPESLVTDSTNETVTIVGLYNRNEKQRYFMVPGYNLHAHVVLDDKQQAGHLRDFALAEGATLYLPE